MQYTVTNQENELFKNFDISLYKVSHFMPPVCDNYFIQATSLLGRSESGLSVYEHGLRLQGVSA